MIETKLIWKPFDEIPPVCTPLILILKRTKWYRLGFYRSGKFWRTGTPDIPYSEEMIENLFSYWAEIPNPFETK